MNDGKPNTPPPGMFQNNRPRGRFLRPGGKSGGLLPITPADAKGNLLANQVPVRPAEKSEVPQNTTRPDEFAPKALAKDRDKRNTLPDELSSGVQPPINQPRDKPKPELLDQALDSKTSSNVRPPSSRRPGETIRIKRLADEVAKGLNSGLKPDSARSIAKSAKALVRATKENPSFVNDVSDRDLKFAQFIVDNRDRGMSVSLAIVGARRQLAMFPPKDERNVPLAPEKLVKEGKEKLSGLLGKTPTLIVDERGRKFIQINGNRLTPRSFELILAIASLKPPRRRNTKVKKDPALQAYVESDVYPLRDIVRKVFAADRILRQQFIEKLGTVEEEGRPMNDGEIRSLIGFSDIEGRKRREAVEQLAPKFGGPRSIKF